MNRIAAIFSYLFHPMLMTTFLFLMLFAIHSPVVLPFANAFRDLMIIVFLVTFVIPSASISFLRITNTITSFKLENRKERIVPFFFTTIFYGVATWMFITKINFGSIITLIFIAITITILILALVTLFWKISAHAAGIGGLLGVLAALYFKDPTMQTSIALMIAVIVSGIVMTSRLQLNSHTPAQVYAGLLTGFVINFSSIYILT